MSIDNDVRLLHRNPAMGYTRSSSMAAYAEPEAISADAQAEMSKRARGRPTAELRKTAERIDAALSHFEQQAGHVADRELRSVRRTLAAVGRRLAER